MPNYPHYRFNVVKIITTQILAIDKIIKCIWKGKKIKVIKAILKKKNKVKGMALLR